MDRSSARRTSLRRIIATIGMGTLVAPLAAHAHGEEALLFPVGQLVALTVAAIAAWRVSSSWLWRSLIFASSAGLAFALWFVPGDVFPSAVRTTGIGNFVLGLVPPVLVAAAGAWAARSRESAQ
jgi:hypothetical protein